MSTSKRVPAASGLFSETAEGPRLLGSKCASCGTPYFPRSAICHNPDCDEDGDAGRQLRAARTHLEHRGPELPAAAARPLLSPTSRTPSQRSICPTACA